MKILGIDFGLKHIGLALAEGPLSQPLGEVRWQSAEKLLEQVKRQGVDLVVLGLPEGKLRSLILDLGAKISAAGIRVDYQDETLTTVEAKMKLIAAGKPQKKRRQEHAAAAAVILQVWLDEHYAG